MKAKDITAAILAADDKVDTISKTLQALLIEAVDIAKGMKKATSQVAVFRQGFQTWRAACAQLTAHNAEQFPETLSELYPSLLCEFNATLFGACIQQCVFIGYEPTLEQEAAVRKSHSALQAAEHQALLSRLVVHRIYGTRRNHRLF